jgi:hypothetical protein
MNRMTIAGVAALMVLASSAQALASMSLSSPQQLEPGCPTTGSAAGTNGKDNIDSSAGIPGLASVATTILPAAATATIPSSATTVAVPSDTTTATIPSGASSATTTGTSRATNATSATTSPSERRRTEQVERWDETSQRIGELARRKGQLQRAVDESAGSRKRGLERIGRLLDIAQKMKPGVLARYR